MIRAIGFILVTVVLGALFYLTQQDQAPRQPQPQFQSSSDSAFKNLKIQ